ncbi:hypothetical protein Hamer_G002263 [Homarus americanus]|uniref:Uncharacterized protein n=1 Tax=Homarus americanus TaxID=6706 RepID=A0A8J5JS54_HOMAM|nr:hypothetical protein Hamer_G002263 [Homarus americanus]
MNRAARDYGAEPTLIGRGALGWSMLSPTYQTWRVRVQGGREGGWRKEEVEKDEEGGGGGGGEGRGGEEEEEEKDKDEKGEEEEEEEKAEEEGIGQHVHVTACARTVIEQHDESLQCRQDTIRQLTWGGSQIEEGGCQISAAELWLRMLQNVVVASRCWVLQESLKPVSRGGLRHCSLGICQKRIRASPMSSSKARRMSRPLLCSCIFGNWANMRSFSRFLIQLWLCCIGMSDIFCDTWLPWPPCRLHSVEPAALCPPIALQLGAHSSQLTDAGVLGVSRLLTSTSLNSFDMTVAAKLTGLKHSVVHKLNTPETIETN